MTGAALGAYSKAFNSLFEMPLSMNSNMLRCREIILSFNSLFEMHFLVFFLSSLDMTAFQFSI